MAIFKISIFEYGIIKFPNSANSAIFADILVKNDTLRVYNIHLQSSGINPNVKQLDSETSDRLLIALAKPLAQQYQAELVLKHMNKSPYKTILNGDFNNTTFICLSSFKIKF